MTRSVYIVGGAGTGKSTFMSEVLLNVGGQMGPLIDIHQTPNSKGTIITLRGHEIDAPYGIGIYLGYMRESFPGTDGLDRISSLPGVSWVDSGGATEYSFVVAEGLNLCTKPFISSLTENTGMLLVHLHVDPVVQDIRFLQRGSMQNETFVQTSITRSANMLRHVQKLDCETVSVDTDDRTQWLHALEICQDWLKS